MRIVLAGGGTGGHIFPLIAVVRQLYAKSERDQIMSPDIVFIGPIDKKATEVFKTNNIRSKRIITGKWRRYFSLLNIFDMVKILLGLLQTFVLLWWYMPNVVFSKGGYGSFPVVVVARLFRIPVIIHESDSVSGAANRILARFADKIITSFPVKFPEFPAEKTVLLGNPVRDFMDIDKQLAHAQLKIQTQKPVVLFLGGSQGALQINSLVLSAIKELTNLYEVIHQVGDKNYRSVKKYVEMNLSQNNLVQYHAFASFNEVEMKNTLSVADVIISRAGAGAIFEIAWLGKPSILIPLETSAGGHQDENARIYEKAGACIILSRPNVAPHLLLSQINGIMSDKNKTEQMSRAALSFAKPAAAYNIAQLILQYDK